jgi:two-component system NtrC family sensor kinase
LKIIIRIMAETTEDKLRERLKELTCLYDVTSAILQHDGSVDETLAKVCSIVKQAYQYSDDAIAELWLEAHYVLTAPLPEGIISQVSRIVVFGDEMGYIKVHYPNNGTKYFLDEEQMLLDKVAVEAGLFFEKLVMQEKEKLFHRNIANADRLSILGEITAGIAHELNTPLGNILGFAELIRSNAEKGQVTEDASKIVSAAIHSREIVKKLMYFSCEMPQHLEEVDLSQLISQSIALLGPNFSKKNITYTFHHEGEPVKTRVDSIQLTQVLFNILLNAIHASPDRGHITITQYAQAGGFAIEIADHGTGIPEDVKPKIYEPFFTTKPMGEGTGLGLSVVHGIIKSHGGSISVRDNSPSGTIFRIELPITMR